MSEAVSGSAQSIVFRDSIKTPAAVSAVSFGSSDILSLGSDDGTFRLYHLPSTRVVKAIKQLGDEVSSIVWAAIAESGQGVVWIASGRKVHCFDLSDSKLILAPEDAQQSLDLGDDEEDALNELTLDEGKKVLAFCTDNGAIGTVDLSTRAVSRMKSSHENICGSARFIPSRPNEVVSGGYDCALLHHDISNRNTLSRHKINAPEPSANVSLSPPFVVALSVSPTGLIAVGLADGRLWLGYGGDKNVPQSQKKRSRKWEGLRASDTAVLQVAEGPVVGVAFMNPTSLVTCTLLGRLKEYNLSYNTDGVIQLQIVWEGQTKGIAKVSAIDVNSKWLVVAGLDNEGKGLAEIWEHAVKSEGSGEMLVHILDESVGVKSIS